MTCVASISCRRETPLVFCRNRSCWIHRFRTSRWTGRAAETVSETLPDLQAHREQNTVSFVQGKALQGSLESLRFCPDRVRTRWQGGKPKNAVGPALGNVGSAGTCLCEPNGGSGNNRSRAVLDYAAYIAVAIGRTTLRVEANGNRAAAENGRACRVLLLADHVILRVEHSIGTSTANREKARSSEPLNAQRIAPRIGAPFDERPQLYRSFTTGTRLT
jgi:hypothetical protein